MSIIDDALRKAQSNLSKAKGKETPAPINTPQSAKNSSTPTQNNAVPKTRTPTTKIIPLLVIPICLGAIFFFFVFNKKSPKTWVITKGLPFPKSDTIKKQFPSIKPRTKPLPKINYAQGTLILNGTSIIDNNRVALINNNIYSVGEIVNGKKILNISNKNVELENETGEIIYLKVGE